MNRLVYIETWYLKFVLIVMFAGRYFFLDMDTICHIRNYTDICKVELTNSIKNNDYI